MARVAIVPSNLNQYSLFTYMFTQANLAHLIVNMFFLAVFGAGVEDAVGRWRLVAIYVVCGIAGGLLQYMVVTRFISAAQWSSPIAGASASCAGLVGVYAVRYYRARVSFALTSARPQVVAVVAVFLVYQIAAAIISLMMNDQQAAAAYWAHIGGFTVGMIIAAILRLPASAEMDYRQLDAYRALEIGRPGESLTRWSAVLASEPNNERALLECARCWVALGDNERASEIFTRLLVQQIAQNERSAAASTAIEMARTELSHASMAGQTMMQLAKALEQNGDFALACRYFAEAAVAEDCPIQDTALLSAATLCAKKLNNPEAAIGYLRRLQEDFPISQWRPQAEDLLKSLTSASKHGT